ncbi:DMT family transporter [Aerococcaceae bacterium WGS1372]
MERLKLITAMVVVGSIGIFVHYIPLPSAVIALFRAVFGTLFLGIVMIVKKKPINWRGVRDNWMYLALSGAAIGFNWIFLFEAYRYTSITVATLCYYMAPVFVLLLAPIVLKEKLSKLNIVTTMVAVVGAVLISGVLSGGEATLTGVGYGLIAAVLYAMIMLLNRLTQGLSGLELTFFQLFVAAIVMAAYVVSTHDMSSLDFSPLAIGLLLIVGIVHTGWVYQLFFSAVNQLPSQTSALLTYIDPITAIILSMIILEQPLEFIQLIGTVLIIGSALLNEIVSARNSSGKAKDNELATPMN